MVEDRRFTFDFKMDDHPDHTSTREQHGKVEGPFPGVLHEAFQVMVFHGHKRMVLTREEDGWRETHTLMYAFQEEEVKEVSK